MIMKSKKAFTKKDLVTVLCCVVFLLISIGAIGNGGYERARELGRRSVCLSNLKQLTLAWLIYADENKDKLVNGAAGIGRKKDKVVVDKAWTGKDWADDYKEGGRLDPNEQKEAIKAGTLWPYCKNLKIYHCPSGYRRDIRTYSIVDSINGAPQPGNPMGRGPKEVMDKLIIKERMQIRRPGRRLVFIDVGWVTPGSFAVHYLKELWWDPAPVLHGDGMNVSFADGHSEYWKWKGKDTIWLGRTRDRTYPCTHFPPTTPEGKEDLHRVQKAVWGELGYTPGAGD